MNFLLDFVLGWFWVGFVIVFSNLFELISSFFFLFFFFLGLKKVREKERGEREKIYLNNKIGNYYNCVYTIIVIILPMYNVIDLLMWIIFEQKCVKLKIFCILHWPEEKSVKLTIFYILPWLVKLFLNFFFNNFFQKQDKNYINEY